MRGEAVGGGIAPHRELGTFAELQKMMYFPLSAQRAGKKISLNVRQWSRREKWVSKRYLNDFKEATGQEYLGWSILIMRLAARVMRRLYTDAMQLEMPASLGLRAFEHWVYVLLEYTCDVMPLSAINHQAVELSI